MFVCILISVAFIQLINFVWRNNRRQFEFEVSVCLHYTVTYKNVKGAVKKSYLLKLNKLIFVYIHDISVK